MYRAVRRFSERRAIEADIQNTKATIHKMEQALDKKYEYLRKLEMELGHADDPSVSTREGHADTRAL